MGYNNNKPHEDLLMKFEFIVTDGIINKIIFKNKNE